MEHYKSPTNDFFHFSNPHDDRSEAEEDDDDDVDDDDDHSCDFHFHPFRSLGVTHSQRPNLQNCGLMDHNDTVNVSREELVTFNNGALISEIDRTMKLLSDNLLYTIEGLSAQLSQLEDKTCQLDNSVDDIKNSAEYYHGKTDEKLRQLQDILQEVQDGVHFLRDKHEITETQLQLAELQGSRRGQRSAVQTDPVQPVSFSASQQSTISCRPQLPSQLPQNQTPSSQPESTWQTPEITVQHYHFPPTQQSQPPHQTYEAASQLSHFPQSPLLPLMHSPHGLVTPQKHLFLSHHSAETPYMPTCSYPSSIHLSPSQPAGWGPTQELDVGMAQPMHGQPLRSADSEFLADYPPVAASFSEMHPCSKLPSSRGSSKMNPVQFSPIPSAVGSGRSYTQLPIAQVLPHALPTASSVDVALGYWGSGNTVPVDDVVEKVTAMGFRRDLVKSTVRKLTENGQSVDLNMVLDKMMNSG